MSSRLPNERLRRDTSEQRIFDRRDEAARAARPGAGIKIIGGTITPFENETFLPGAWNPTREAVRQVVNAWIRQGNGFDAMIDFDQAVRDPDRLSSMLSIYDSGDHLHQSDRGYNHMGDIIDLSLFD